MVFILTLSSLPSTVLSVELILSRISWPRPPSRSLPHIPPLPKLSLPRSQRPVRHTAEGHSQSSSPGAPGRCLTELISPFFLNVLSSSDCQSCFLDTPFLSPLLTLASFLLLNLRTPKAQSPVLSPFLSTPSSFVSSSSRWS